MLYLVAFYYRIKIRNCVLGGKILRLEHLTLSFIISLVPSLLINTILMHSSVCHIYWIRVFNSEKRRMISKGPNSIVFPVPLSGRLLEMEKKSFLLSPEFLFRLLVWVWWWTLFLVYLEHWTFFLFLLRIIAWMIL